MSSATVAPDAAASTAPVWRNAWKVRSGRPAATLARVKCDRNR